MNALFSTRLRNSTASIHNEVEHTHFMVDLMEGRLEASSYTALIRQYEPIYAALEHQSREFAADPVFAPFSDSRLERHTRILADLRTLPLSDYPVTEAARDYAERIERIEEPERLIAHHYTRYLGDLSGGQAIGTLMARHYGIDRSALSMWDFSELGKTKPYKDDYRLRLDAIAAHGGREQTVIDETLLAFELNGRLLGELTRLAGTPGVTVA